MNNYINKLSCDSVITCQVHYYWIICFQMLVVFLNAIISNHKLVRVNLRLERDTY